MNFARYSTIYQRFHGCLSVRNEEDMIVLDFTDMPFDPWDALHLYKHDYMCMKVDEKPFAQALKVFFKSEDPITVTYANESWTALLGSSKTIMPMLEKAASFQLISTPFFVRDPSIVSEYLQGSAHAATDTVFLYKNCVLFLDNNDLPYPGGSYFKTTPPCSRSLYRICILSNESHAVSIAREWKSRRDVIHAPFLTKETISTPQILDFRPISQPYLPDERVVSTGLIQKRLSMQNPHLLMQDILVSFHRNLLHEERENVDMLKQLGLIVEWPFRITFEGTRPSVHEDNLQFVAFSVNGMQPKHVLCVRYPYEMYTQYQEVPAIPWTSIYYEPIVLELPKEIEKVSVDSVVIGYVYKKSFFAFSFPLLEGRPATSKNIHYIFQPATLTEEFKVLESFQYNNQYSLHRVLQKGVPYHAWCLAETKNVHPQVRRLPELVREWLKLYENHKEIYVDEKIVRMAFTLARHKTCFKTRIDPDREGNVIVLGNKSIELKMGKHEVDFINSVRVVSSAPEEKENSCVIC